MWGRKCFLWTLAMVFFCLSAIAFTDGPPSPWPAADVFLIDNFDKGTLTGTPRWWSFDRVALSFHESELEQNSLYALHVGGTAENYYVGGIGTYIGKDLPGYNTLAMDVKGSGLNSCRIKIELYQNDHGDWQMSKDALGAPMHNACFSHELSVDWTDWRRIYIPLQQFKHTNPGVGSEQLKLGYADGSGGLLSFQLIFIAPTPKGTIDVYIDNVRLIKRNEQ